MIIGYGASDASEKILKELSKNTWQNKIIILYFYHARRKRQKLKTFTLLFFAALWNWLARVRALAINAFGYYPFHLWGIEKYKWV